MKIKGEDNEKRKSAVSVTLWDRNGKLTSKGRKSLTFTVEGTTMEELSEFIKEAVRYSE